MKTELDFIVERLLKITSSGGTTCSYARSEILEIVHTLENKYDYEVPNMAHLEDQK